MNPSLSYVLFLLFIIAALSMAAEEIVKDATGKKVLDNVAYRIGPVSSGKGGAIKLTAKINNKKVCPYDVVQDPNDEVGGGFAFSLIIGDGPKTKKDKYLKTSRVLGIGSGDFKGACDQRFPFWTINDPEEKPPLNLITTGGGFDDGITCFQLVDYPKPTNPKVNSYMLQHCPYYCGGTPPVKCYNVSVYVDKGVRRLASAGATPFEFVFHKL